MAKVRVVSKAHTPVIQTEKPGGPGQAVQNNMFGGFGGQDTFGVGFQGFGPTGMGSSMEEVSDTTTLFTNLRWYLVSNFRQLLSQLYVEIGLIKTLVDVPVDDALRGGFEIKTKQLDENQIKELNASMEYDNDIGTLGQAAKWERLFGGSGIMIIVGDQDPEEPLDLDSIGPDTEVEFRAVDMWELFWDKQNTDGYDPAIQTEIFEFYDYYAEKVHKSRVMKMKGMISPSFIRPRLRGWGFSVVESLVRSMNQYLKSVDLTFEVMDEFKIDYYKIKNLVSSALSPTATNKVRETAMKMNLMKNYNNAVVMDSEDDWDQKQLSFAGLAEVGSGIRKQICADLRFPASKLFGSSESTGLGNADQNDMENYNSMVESSVRTPLKFHALRLIQIKCQKLFGFIPDDLEIKYQPLRVLSAIDEETVKTQKFNRVSTAKEKGELTTQEYRDACNKGNLFDIQLDTTLDSIDEGESDDEQLEEVLSGETAESASGGLDENKEPGANGFDSRSTKSKQGTNNKTGKKVEADKNKKTNANDQPRAADGKFGSGGEKSKKKKEPKTPAAPSTDTAAEIASLLEEAEKADDSNSHHKAEALREKARKLDKKKNDIFEFNVLDQLKRFFNSPQFDRHSYEADGGDEWIDSRREPLFVKSSAQDQALYMKAEEASRKALGSVDWKFVTWWYKKQGGKF